MPYVLRSPLRDYRNARSFTIRNRTQSVYFDRQDLSADLRRPTQAKNTTPHDLAIGRVNAVHLAVGGSGNDDFPETECIAE